MSKPSDAALLAAVQDGRFGPEVLKGSDKRLYRYGNGMWTPDGESELALRVMRYLGVEACNAADVDRVLRLANRDFPNLNLEDERHGNKHLINCANGVVDVSGSVPQLRAWSPDYYFTYRVPHNWNPIAQCPRIEAALDRMFEDEMKAFLLQLFGYSMLPLVNHKVAILLYSRKPDTGKSTILRLLQALVGQGNFATVSLQQLAEDRFMRANLQHKLIDVSGDLSDRAAATSAYFKQLTGSDWITVERKGQHSFDMRNTAKLWFAGNDYPQSEDQGEAYVRRWVVIPLEHQHVYNPNFEQELHLPSELEGLFRLAVLGATNLVQHNRLILPKPVKDATKDYLFDIDTVVRFLEENTKHEEGYVGTPQPELYKLYRDWATDAGQFPVGARKFGHRLRDRGERIERSNGKAWVRNRRPVMQGAVPSWREDNGI